MMKTEKVFLIEERTLATLISLGAHFSTVRYTRGGIDYEVQIPNDEFEFYGEDTNGDDTED